MSLQITTATELCYFAALIDGLRLINEKAATRKIKRFSLNANERRERVAA